MNARRERNKVQKAQMNKQLAFEQNTKNNVEDNRLSFEAGKFCLDIAKLVFGGVILAGIMQANHGDGSLIILWASA